MDVEDASSSKFYIFFDGYKKKLSQLMGALGMGLFFEFYSTDVRWNTVLFWSYFWHTPTNNSKQPTKQPYKMLQTVNISTTTYFFICYLFLRHHHLHCWTDCILCDNISLQENKYEFKLTSFNTSIKKFRTWREASITQDYVITLWPD